MNTKGVVEIVFLNLVYQNHLITQEGYFALMMMTLIGTILTSVYLKILQADAQK